jgi:segregation and condensation protein B
MGEKILLRYYYLMNQQEIDCNIHTNNQDQRKKLALLEASLHVAYSPLKLKTLGSVIGVPSEVDVLDLARQLVDNYKRRDTALEVVELAKHRFVLQLKPQYTKIVKKVSLAPVLKSGELKTLSYIAYHQPVLQKQVAEVRGSHAYKHLRQLENMSLISRELKGRTKIIRTTDQFADYLGLSHHLGVMKRQIKKILNKKVE